MTEQTTTVVPEYEVGRWYRAGWSYVSRDPMDASMCVLRWDSDREPVQPFRPANPVLDKGRAEG